MSEFKPCLMVYAGRRIMTNKKPGACFFPLIDDQLSATGSIFDVPTKSLVLGGVYTGAELKEDGSSVRGLRDARFKELYYDKDSIRLWRDDDGKVAEELALQRRMKDARGFNELESALLDVRKQYAKLYDRGDVYGMKALEREVIRALKTKPKSSEMEN